MIPFYKPQIFHLPKYITILLVFCLFFANIYSGIANVWVIRAVNGTTLCADAYTLIGDILLYEASSNDFTKNQANNTLILTVPSGFEFRAATGAVFFEEGLDITAASMVVTTTTITVTFSTNDDPYTLSDKILISGIQAKAVAALPIASTGNILRLSSNPGTAVIAGVTDDVSNFGTLSQANAQTYSSSTTQQGPTFNVALAESSAPILALKVTMTDDCARDRITDIHFTTTGSSDPTGDINAASVYYSGSSPHFNSAQFLGSVANPNGAFSIPLGATTPYLTPGDNYFWLTYDIKGAATSNNLVDATITSFDMIANGNTTPTVSNPAGSRAIGVKTVTSNAIGGGVWSMGTSWGGGVVPANGDHVIISAGDVITLTSTVMINDLTINNGANLLVGSGTITVIGEFILNGTGDMTTTCNSTLIIGDRGAAQQFVFAPSTIDMERLELGRVDGALVDHSINLSLCVPADSLVLVLSEGILYITNGKLLLESIDIQTDIPSSETAFVDGLIRRYVSANGDMIFFPVGNDGLTRRFGVYHNAGALSYHEVQFFNGAPINYDYVNSVKLSGGVINNYYWSDEYGSVTTGGGNPVRRMYYKDSDFPQFTVNQRLADLAFADNNANVYNEPWNTPNTGWNVFDAPDEKYLEFVGPNASGRRYWTFGSENSDSPIQHVILPIELLELSAIVVNNTVHVDWATASETNSGYFTVQRSSNNADFENIATLQAAGTSNIRKDYNFIDFKPMRGISYYRLIESDNQNNNHNVGTRAVRIDGTTNSGVTMYPNPSDGLRDITLNLESFRDREVTITVNDMLGNLYFIKKSIVNGSATELICFDNQLATGIYIVLTTDGVDMITEKLIIN